MRITGYVPIGEKRSSLRIRVGEAELFFYGEHLIGLVTPEGTWRLQPSTITFSNRERSSIKSRQAKFGLTASWVADVPSMELEDKAGRAWLKDYAKYARERMAGGEAL